MGFKAIGSGLEECLWKSENYVKHCEVSEARTSIKNFMRRQKAINQVLDRSAVIVKIRQRVHCGSLAPVSFVAFKISRIVNCVFCSVQIG